MDEPLAPDPTSQVARLLRARSSTGAWSSGDGLRRDSERRRPRRARTDPSSAIPRSRSGFIDRRVGQRLPNEMRKGRCGRFTSSAPTSSYPTHAYNTAPVPSEARLTRADVERRMQTCSPLVRHIETAAADEGGAGRTARGSCTLRQHSRTRRWLLRFANAMAVGTAPQPGRLEDPNGITAEAIRAPSSEMSAETASTARRCEHEDRDARRRQRGLRVRS